LSVSFLAGPGERSSVYVPPTGLFVSPLFPLGLCWRGAMGFHSLFVVTPLLVFFRSLPARPRFFFAFRFLDRADRLPGPPTELRPNPTGRGRFFPSFFRDFLFWTQMGVHFGGFDLGFFAQKGCFFFGPFPSPNFPLASHFPLHNSWLTLLPLLDPLLVPQLIAVFDPLVYGFFFFFFFLWPYPPTFFLRSVLNFKAFFLST